MQEPQTRGGRGRGRNRGGLGKYLRARGRGRGRPAVFTTRLLLEGEGDHEETEEEVAERSRKFSKRELGSNADRYLESEPELDSDGKPIIDPEVDLSAFLERQRISEFGPSLPPPIDDVDQDDVDHSLAHISSQSRPTGPQKGKVKVIEWDEELQKMSREKASAEAISDLKSRFRAQSTKLRNPIIDNRNRDRKADTYIEAPPLPLQDGSVPPQKDRKQEMEDFLDDLLT